MKTKKHSAGYYIGFLIFIIVALINIYPMVFSIFCSFKGNLEIFSSFTALPKKLRIENYLTAWNVGNIGRYFLNTIILAVGTLAISGLFGAMASYVLAKFKFRRKIKNIFTVYFRNDDSYSGGINSVVLYFWKTWNYE